MKSKSVLVFISHLSIGGTEMQTLNTVRALVEGGYSVTVWCLYRCIPSTVQAFKNAGANVKLSSPQYNHYGIDIFYHSGVSFMLFLVKELYKILRQRHFDIFHVQYMTPGATVILLLKYVFFKNNIITTAHTAADIYPNLKLIHFIQRHCVKVWTCITERAETSFFGSSELYDKSLTLKNRNHFTINNSLPKKSNNKSTSETDNVKDKKLVIGVVSRLVEIKGMDLVVPAFAKVKEEHQDVRLIVVGDGSLKERMMEQARELGCEDAVEWTGRLAQEELAEWYQKMDIVLMPSRSEGFGLTAIEAMDNGCVMVVSDVGGLPEVVRDGEVGLLHRSEDVDDLAEKICRLLDNPKLMEEMKGRVKGYVERFSYERYKELILDLYRKI